jgi:hypothetical protein
MKRLILGAAGAIALVAAGVAIGRGTRREEPRTRPAFVIRTNSDERTVVLSDAHQPPQNGREGAALLGRTLGDDRLWTRAWLVRYLEEHPEEALALFAQESDPEILEIIAEALDPVLALRFLDGDAAHRAAALAALQHLNDLSPEARAAVGRLAADGDIAAMATLVAWIRAHPGERASLGREVLAIARSAQDAEVRGHAIQAVALPDGMPADVIEGAAAFLSDPDEQNRTLAAMAVGNSTNREWALATLETAFGAERSAEVRREMLIHLVRAGREAALPVLERIGDAHALEYARILRSGVTDPLEVFERKQELDLERGITPVHED